MRTLQPLAIDDTLVYDNIAAAKMQPRRARLQRLRPKVLAAYDAYSEGAPEVADLPEVTLTPLQSEALIHAYEVTTAPMTALRGQLLDRIIAVRCPFCGLGESATLDHYLPKEKFPQFSTFSKNLVPCCTPCNTRKSQLIVDGDTDIRLFLHPYFDEIPDASFLALNIALSDDAISLNYEVVRPDGMRRSLFQQLQSHLALSRFYGVAEDALRVSAELSRDSDDFAQLHGANHWRAVLYRELAQHDTFCDGGFEVLRQIQ
jgi:hypothetical protein